MRMFMREPLFAIGRGLQAEYLPAVRQPLPNDIEALLAGEIVRQARRLAAGYPVSVSAPEAACREVSLPAGDQERRPSTPSGSETSTRRPAAS